MPKSAPGSNRYLKAQLRPLMRPAFWASTGLFGLSLFTLVSLLRQPEQQLGTGDPNAVVNLDGNETLTPEERARAAEIDDLSVLLKELDEGGTLESVSSRLTQEQKPSLDTPEALTATDLPKISATSSSTDFEALPLLNLSPQPLNSAAGLPATTTQGFTGFDPRSQGAAGGVIGTVNSSSTTTSPSLSPLAAALQQYSTQNAQTPNVLPTSSNGLSGSGDLIDSTNSPDSRDLTDRGNLNTASVTGETAFSPSNLNSSSLPQLESINANTPLGSPNPPNASSPLNSLNQPSTFPTNYSNLPSNNAYNQLLNPDLVVPNTAPISSPSLPASSSLTATPLEVIPASAPTLSTVPPGRTTPLPRVTPNQLTTTPTTSVGQPPTSPTIPTGGQSPITTPAPAPFSVPNQPPARYSGNGQINTFANP